MELSPEIVKNLAILAGVIILVQVFNILRNRFVDNKRSSYTLQASSYTPKEYFFSYSELELYRLLSDFLTKQYGSKYAIFPKVRLLDLADTKYKINFNKIAQKHVDFLIVDQTKHCTPVLAIELNGDSHNNKQTEYRDQFVVDFFETIKIQILIIWNQALKNPNNITREITNILLENQ